MQSCYNCKCTVASSRVSPSIGKYYPQCIMIQNLQTCLHLNFLKNYWKKICDVEYDNLYMHFIFNFGIKEYRNASKEGDSDNWKKTLSLSFHVLSSIFDSIIQFRRPGYSMTIYTHASMAWKGVNIVAVHKMPHIPQIGITLPIRWSVLFNHRATFQNFVGAILYWYLKFAM